MAERFAQLELHEQELRLSGDWSIAHTAPIQKKMERILAQQPSIDTLDARAVSRMDAAGAVMLLNLAQKLGLDEQDIHVNPNSHAIIKLIRPADDSLTHIEQAPKPPRFSLRLFIEEIGEAVSALVPQCTSLIAFLGLVLQTLWQIIKQPKRLRVTSWLHHMDHVGIRATPLICLLSFLVGAVLAFLGANVLESFGAQIFVAELVLFAFLREFGVLLTAILLAGRTASAFTAQIGSMKSNEEIDAIRTLGLNPIEVLVIPRLLALLVMLPLLAFLAAISGLAGGAVASSLGIGINLDLFLSRMAEARNFDHFLVGMLKAPVFAMVIALVGCLEGMKVSGSAQSVGEHTTSSVVQSIFLVILLDAMFAIFFMEVGM